MEAGIVGLPNVGKSTLFNALTAAGIASENYPFCTIEPNVGAVAVPDDRLARIGRYITSERTVPAILQLVDIAGIVRGASEGEGLGNQFLAAIRNVDAILHVVRCFDDDNVTHVDGAADPIRDIETIDTELMLADLQSVESMAAKAARIVRSGDKDAKLRLEMLDLCREHLNGGQPIRAIDFDDAVRTEMLASFQLLTAKRVLYVCNVDESDPLGHGNAVARVAEKAKADGGLVVPVCARLEAEIAELDGDDQLELLQSIGLAEPALGVLARASYRLLGVHSFFTAGEKQIRAWTIPIGTTAPQAAGTIHTDFQRGFIRAEVYTVEDLEQWGSEKAIREAGKLRVEGKKYVVNDGDVCYFLFNV